MTAEPDLASMSPEERLEFYVTLGDLMVIHVLNGTQGAVNAAEAWRARRIAEASARMRAARD